MVERFGLAGWYSLVLFESIPLGVEGVFTKARVKNASLRYSPRPELYRRLGVGLRGLIAIPCLFTCLSMKRLAAQNG